MPTSYLLSRSSESYREHLRIWKRSFDAYSGGSSYIKKSLIRHVSEPLLEYRERLARAVYLNLPRKVANLLVEHLFRAEPDRPGADENIVKNCSLDRDSINVVMAQAEIMRIIFGESWIYVGFPPVREAISLEEKQKLNLRPFARPVSPLSVVDYDDAHGHSDLEWLITEENVLDKRDPAKPPVLKHFRRLWTRSDWNLYDVENGETPIASGVHNLGRVPFIHLTEYTGANIGAFHWFEDVVRISDAVMNAMSEAQMNIVKQMFGLLVVSEAFAMSGGAIAVPENSSPEETDRIERVRDEYRSALSRSSSLWETPDEKGLTRYISPSGAETECIVSWIKFLRESLNDVLRLALQSLSRDAQTAEAKAWDNRNTEQALAVRSGQLEDYERSVWELMHLWDPSVTVPEISYSRDFSVTDLKTMVDSLMNISSFDEIGDEFRRAVYDKALVILDKIDRLPVDQYNRVKKEIESLKFESRKSASPDSFAASFDKLNRNPEDSIK